MKDYSYFQDNNSKVMEINYEHKSCNNCWFGCNTRIGCSPAMSKTCDNFRNWKPDNETKSRGGIK
jgi:hypothetical protein